LPPWLLGPKLSSQRPAESGAARLASLLRSSTASTSSLEGRKDHPQKPHLRAAAGV